VWLGTNKALREELGVLKANLEDSERFGQSLLEKVREQRSAFEKLQHQKKSSEVKTGAIVEQLVGFLDEFPYPDDEIKALYQPIDLIVFRPDEIVFVEVKSGDSQLSEKQRKIRDMIEEKKVRFEVHRINGKGYKVK
jgi:predicted Holliday junction resolvase-like endonuclease